MMVRGIDEGGEMSSYVYLMLEGHAIQFPSYRNLVRMCSVVTLVAHGNAGAILHIHVVRNVASTVQLQSNSDIR